ncbi:aminomethyl transferase family protein [Nonomuraea mesophila]|uniref:Aminomethyl transferase family protein n=1 Tax=Nonomuraea mesophila TaxID=2530382 RepID=A0A4R5F6M9_9ACTN|nr:aminomethyltransferase family protein [Nonomuraea mesophila]TDE43679.1 aminomethyl transferase family protein [Nonomuraea mesophila]
MTTVTHGTSPLRAVHPDTAEYQTMAGVEAVWRMADPREEPDKEYESLRDGVGLIDWGTCRLVEVRGDHVEWLQRLLTRDVEYLAGERTVCSLVLDEAGRVVDIVTVYGRDGGVLLESSVGGGERLWAHMTACADDGVELVDRSGELTVVGLEGPSAWRIISHVFGEGLSIMPYESTADTEFDGRPVLLARTGVTGEYGYKVIADHDTARAFWKSASVDATPVGLEAVETAMLEVRQPIMQREVSDEFGVIAQGLNWLVDSGKESFTGRAAMMAEFEGGAAVQTIGFAGSPDATPPPRGARVLADGRPVGSVVHAVVSGRLGAVLGLMRIEVSLAAAGLPFTVDHEGGLEVETLNTPYVRPKSWITPIS